MGPGDQGQRQSLVGDGARVLDRFAPLGHIALQDVGEFALRGGHHFQPDLGQAFLRLGFAERGGDLLVELGRDIGRDAVRRRAVTDALSELISIADKN